ncbi:hypothetical protein [Tomitella biformata]|uniref:hypothetical protein n=1 Tax=Tomitella biformata TaxID=630403 RepID=UPI0034E24A18
MFKAAGIDYDEYERHSDVGGIWDIDNPGSPMNESAHFISSRAATGASSAPPAPTGIRACHSTRASSTARSATPRPTVAPWPSGARGC